MADDKNLARKSGLSEEEAKAAFAPPRPSKLQELIERTIGRQLNFGCADDIMQMQVPQVWEWMTRVDATPEKLIEPANIRIRAVHDGFNIVLTQNSLGAQCEITCKFWEDILPALEAAIAKGEIKTLAKGGRGMKKRQA